MRNEEEYLAAIANSNDTLDAELERRFIEAEEGF